MRAHLLVEHGPADAAHHPQRGTHLGWHDVDEHDFRIPGRGHRSCVRKSLQRQLGEIGRNDEGLGGHGELVETRDQLAPALKRAMASGKTACVNVKAKGVISPIVAATSDKRDKASIE